MPVPAPRDADVRSTFTYDHKNTPYSFSLIELTLAANAHFNRKCVLRQLSEGGYHKIYDILECEADGTEASRSLDAVIRVASPAFPGDKMRSEIATLSYIAIHTSVPVPSVYAWNTEASNSVGAEWMIMQKIALLQIPGIVPYDPWTEDTLPIEIKAKVVRQVVQHFRELFSLRFEKAGSIYFASDAYSRSSNSRDERCHSEFQIGPVVSNPFFRYVDGELDYPSTDLHSPGSSSFNALHALRGPFSHAGVFLASSTRANLFKCETFPRATLGALDTEDEKPSEKEQTDRQRKSSLETSQETLERAKRIMKKGIELCDVYPGDACVWGEEISTPDRPFTLYWYDFRLANFLINPETGKVNGYIDLECVITAPLWVAAQVTDWIPDPLSDRTAWWGGTRGDQFRLWKTFHSTMDECDTGGEWRKAYEGGKWFRPLHNLLGFRWGAWASAATEKWVNERLAWARQEGKEGLGMPDSDDDWEAEWILEKYGPDPDP